MIEGLETLANLEIPKDISSDATNKYLIDACARFDVKCPPPQTTARLLDKVFYVLSLFLKFLLLCPLLFMYFFYGLVDPTGFWIWVFYS